MGIVHHSNYAVWFEAGRTDFLNKAGAANSSIEARGVLLPVYEMNCRYKSPARYEDEILVVTRLKQVSVSVCAFRIGCSMPRIIRIGNRRNHAAWQTEP